MTENSPIIMRFKRGNVNQNQIPLLITNNTYSKEISNDSNNSSNSSMDSPNQSVNSNSSNIMNSNDLMSITNKNLELEIRKLRMELEQKTSELQNVIAIHSLEKEQKVLADYIKSQERRERGANANNLVIDNLKDMLEMRRKSNLDLTLQIKQMNIELLRLQETNTSLKIERDELKAEVQVLIGKKPYNLNPKITTDGTGKRLTKTSSRFIPSTLYSENTANFADCLRHSRVSSPLFTAKLSPPEQMMMSKEASTFWEMTDDESEMGDTGISSTNTSEDGYLGANEETANYSSFDVSVPQALHRKQVDSWVLVNPALRKKGAPLALAPIQECSSLNDSQLTRMSNSNNNLKSCQSPATNEIEENAVSEMSIHFNADKYAWISAEGFVLVKVYSNTTFHEVRHFVARLIGKRAFNDRRLYQVQFYMKSRGHGSNISFSKEAEAVHEVPESNIVEYLPHPQSIDKRGRYTFDFDFGPFTLGENNADKYLF